jgi:hypothetical protein
MELDPRHSDFDGLAYRSFSRHFGSVQDLRVDLYPSDGVLESRCEVRTTSLAVPNGQNHCVEDLGSADLLGQGLGA